MIHCTSPFRPLSRRRGLSCALAAALTLLLLPGAALAQTHTFLWKATKGDGVVYLLGSVHVLTKDFYPLNPALENAYREAATLVEEVDMGEMLSPDAQMQMLGRGMLPAGQTLDQVLSAPTRALVNKAVEELGIPSAALQLMKPWMAALSLDALEWQKAGFDADLGLDKHFYDTATRDGKPIEGLETTQYQLSLFDGMSMEQQDRLLAETLKELNTEQANLSAAALAWKTGDAPTLERIALEDMRSDPALYQRLLVDRNRNWLPKIEALFSRPKPSLVVVGAAHLIGPDGLLQMLRARGYAIEQQ